MVSAVESKQRVENSIDIGAWGRRAILGAINSGCDPHEGVKSACEVKTSSSSLNLGLSRV